MKQLEALADLRALLDTWRHQGTIALVPTMGNLHQGHLQLVRHAQQRADRVVVSLFVNPMQFGEGEDFASYPRTLEADSRLLEDVGADLLFTPSVASMYPRAAQEQTRVEVPGLSDQLCGASRPGHFAGVATVVCKLFNMVQPDLACFGKKDYQQLMVIQRMVEDLSIPVQVIGIDTVREADGLAMSSRNGYLTAQERGIAGGLFELLQQVSNTLQDGETDFARQEQQALESLNQKGFIADYFSIRRSNDLAVAEPGDTKLVIVAAAWLGKARLIDNLEVVLPDSL